jgi:hypothetical protein
MVPENSSHPPLPVDGEAKAASEVFVPLAELGSALLPSIASPPAKYGEDTSSSDIPNPSIAVRKRDYEGKYHLVTIVCH